jgi:hypothetical protein
MNWSFHQVIYEGTHNAFIAEQAMALRDRMAAFRRTQLRETGRPVRSREEHGDVVSAIMRGDGEEAARCMRAHMFNASIALERFTAKREEMGGGDPAARSAGQDTIRRERRGMAIYGTALLALCTLLGAALGEVLGVALHVKANVGGVGIAMLLLIAAKAWLARQGKLTPACAWAWNSGP